LNNLKLKTKYNQVRASLNNFMSSKDLLNGNIETNYEGDNETK